MVEPFVEFFDFSGWAKGEKRGFYDSETVCSWMPSVNAVIQHKTNAFPHLKGMKASCEMYEYHLNDIFQDWSGQFEVIDIRLPYVSSTAINQLNQVLSRNKVALQSAAIKIYGVINDDCVGEIPPHWPYDDLDVQLDFYSLVNLQHLTLSLVDYCTPPYLPQKFPQRLWDIYKLRQVL